VESQVETTGTSISAAELRIVQAIAAAEDRSSGSAELAAQVNDLLSARHLGAQACNLLRPLAALLDGPVLEVGSRLGALTRYLGENSPSVIALDCCPWRHTATASRCEGLPHVQTYCEDFKGFHQASNFRLITFVDTLQGTEAARCLERAREMLAENGYVLIAASNRRRCTGKEGLRSLGEWHELLDACAMEAAAVLYPFPDHRVPTLLLTDRAFHEAPLNIAALLEGCTAGDGLWQEIPWALLVENRIASQFASSFAIVARRRGSATEPGLDDPSCLVYHYSTARLPAFRKQTRILDEAGRLMVRRRRLHPELPGREGYEHRVEDEPYFEGRLYSDALLESLRIDGWSVAAIAEWARPWLDYLRAHARPGAAGIPELPPRFLDCVPFNLVLTPGGELRPIDMEYASHQPLPLDFPAFRGVWHSLARARTSSGMREWRLAELTFAVLEALGMEIPPERRRHLIDREADFQHALTGADRVQLRTSLAGILLAGGPPATPIESQLFWRHVDAEFSEQASVRIRTPVCSEVQTLRWHIPAEHPAPAELRLDIADRAGIVRLFRLCLADEAAATLWEWNRSAATLAAARHDQMDFAALPASGGAILRLQGNDPQLVLPIGTGQLELLRNGGFFEAEFAWLALL